MYDYIEEKTRKPRKCIDKAVRKLKVYEVSGGAYKRVPQIRLTGEWLERLGFKAGDEIEVKYENSKVVIAKK